MELTSLSCSIKVITKTGQEVDFRKAQDYENLGLYALVLDDRFRIVDPTNPSWTACDGELWSLTTQTPNSKGPTLISSCFCKSVDGDLRPSEVTDEYSNLDSLIIHHMILGPVPNDSCFVYVWYNASTDELVYAQNILISKTKSKTRSGYVCIEINNMIPTGDWNVLVFTNGELLRNDSFRLKRYQTYKLPARFKL